MGYRGLEALGYLDPAEKRGNGCDKTGEVVRDCLCCTMLTRVRNTDFIQNPMGVH